MVDRTRKKKTRYRGSKTHGGGSMKKRRGAGHRGGRGNAGRGKRSDAKKPSVWKTYKSGKDPGKRGFKSLSDAKITINAGHLSSIAPRLASGGKAIEKSGTYHVSLHELGYDKLLGAGVVREKLSVSVKEASPRAKEKIEAAGGTLDAAVVDKEAVKAGRASKKGQEKKKPKKDAEDDEESEEPSQEPEEEAVEAE